MMMVMKDDDAGMMMTLVCKAMHIYVNGQDGMNGDDEE